MEKFMPDKIDEKYVIEEYKKNKSTYVIAKELNTYPNKIKRILNKHGYTLRDKQDAQVLALKSGRSKHPTMGRKRTESEKNKISNGMEKRWASLDDEYKKDFAENAKKRWKEMPADKKREMQEMAGRALRIASIEGSKAEKLLKKRLENNGYIVVLHKENLVPGNYEIDLFLPQINTIIEIDGPQHFLPMWGEERLNQTIKSDQIKNGLLLNHGYCVVRIKYMCARMTRGVEQRLWKLVEPIINNIANNFPKKNERFIELEIET